MGPKYNSTAEDLLKKFEELSLHQLKNMGVDFLGDLIKIIMGQDPEAVEVLYNDEEFQLSEVDSKIGEWFKKAWAKVKAFFDKLGHQIKDFFDDLGKKIKAAFEKWFSAEVRAKIVATLKRFGEIILKRLEEIFNKYKKIIISSLTNIGKVVVQEAEDLLKSVIEGVVKTVIDIIHKLVGGEAILNDDLEYDTTIDSIADCVKAEKVCMNASTGIQKVKCLIDLATCVGGETAKCAQKCGPPAVSCVKEAIFGGKVADIPKCFQTFVKCAADCSKSSEMDLFVDAAIQDFHEKFPQVESIADCVKAEKDCMSASTGMEKVKCLIDLATCVGGETAKCAQKCGPPVVTCVKDAIFGGKVADIPICFQTFVKCAADCAKSSDEELTPNLDIWQKFLDMLKKVKGVIKESTLKVLKKHKQEIIDAVMHLKNVIIACGEDIIIEIKNGIIKIITDGNVLVSDGSNPNDFYYDDGYIMIIYPEDTNAGLKGIRDLWNKVKDAFKNLKEKIKAKSKDLFDKLGPIADKVLEKYQAQIMAALEKGGKVIIDEGKKIVISVVDDVVKVIIDGIEAFSKKLDI